MRHLLLAAALLLAGCASAPDDDGDAGEAPSVVTDPRDLAASMAPGSHVHDYWGGREQVEVLDGTSGGGTVTYGGDNGTVASFQPPEGNIVPQGTGLLEATLDWQEDDSQGLVPGSAAGNQYTHVELWVQTAADGESGPVARVEKGVPLRFNSTNAQADPPHYTVSLWRFDVRLWNEGGEQTSFTGTWSLKVTAFRTLPLEPFPPHPDLWKGAAEIPLLAHDEAVQLHTGLVVTYGCFGGCADVVLAPDDGVIVPPDAREVVVRVATDPASTPVPFALQVHGADTRAPRDVAPESAAPYDQVFRVPVEGGQGDSPYAKQSLWRFRVHLSTPMDQGAFTGTYHVTATAYR